MNWRKHPPELLVYALIDPRKDCIFYVGMTEKGIVRPLSHWKDACVRGLNDRCHVKIRKILKLNLEPDFVVLERPETVQEMKDLERFWICSIKATGAVLTNQNDGGSGGRIEGIREKLASSGQKNRGRKHTAEAKKKISEAQRGHTMPTHVREILSKRNRGRKKSPEEIEKQRQRLLGRKRPDFAQIMSQKRWYTSPDGTHAKMFHRGSNPDGWVEGRKNYHGPQNRGKGGRFSKS